MNKLSNDIMIKAPLESVLAVILRVKDYPKFMPSVQKIEILDYAEDRMEFVSRMTAGSSIFPVPIVTVQRVYYDIERMEIHIKQIEGKLKAMRSMRSIDQEGDYIRVYNEVEYELPPGIIGSIMRPLAQKSVQENIDGLLTGYKAQAEAIEPAEGFMEKLKEARNLKELIPD